MRSSVRATLSLPASSAPKPIASTRPATVCLAAASSPTISTSGAGPPLMCGSAKVPAKLCLSAPTTFTRGPAARAISSDAEVPSSVVTPSKSSLSGLVRSTSTLSASASRSDDTTRAAASYGTARKTTSARVAAAW